MYDIDAEVTRRVEVGHWSFVGSFGGRYASIDRLLAINDLIVGPPANSEFFDLESQTSAGGLTGAIEMSTCLGSGWEVFGILRASPLWGTTTGTVNARENMGGLGTTFSTSASANTELTIWEAQVGLQCTKLLACCQGSVFARCGFEYQSWNESFNESSTGVDLYGVAFAIGLTR